MGQPRSQPDPTTSADPATRRVLQGLQLLATAPALVPAANFQVELRHQLVSVTPRLVAEGAAELPTEPTRHRRASFWSRARRPVLILVSTAAVFIALLGSAVYLSGHSLPGDALYGVKRASENVQLSIASGDTAKGKEYLSLAGTRADEVSDLLGHAGALTGRRSTAAADVNAHTAKLISDTFDTADSQTRNGASLLNSQAVRSATSAPLTGLLTWAPGQQQRLQSIINRIPAGSLHDRAVVSLDVVTAALARARSLQPLLAATCQTTTPSDAYGPLPAATCRPATTTPAPGSTPSVNHPTTATSNQPGSKTTPGAPTASAGATAPGAPIPSAVISSTPGVPSLPLPSSVLPTGALTTDTCGVGVNLPPLSVNLGSCGISIGIGH